MGCEKRRCASCGYVIVEEGSCPACGHSQVLPEGEALAADLIAAEFQRRRTAFLGGIVVFLSLCVLMVAAVVASTSALPILGPYRPIFFLIMIAGIFGLVVLGLTVFRCPRCGTVPTGDGSGADGDEGNWQRGGFRLNPKVCHGCQARLMS